ncbi:MAG: polysaccharide biosynthesis protein [Bacteroidia bacterium]|jgi:O-antigen/teichoic acid export membrane protein
MFIVVPYLTSNPTIYGIYSISISISIFLAYADLGFMSAGQKYASEAYAQGDKKGEIGIVGFTNFILLIFLLLFTLVFFVFSLYPEWLIKDLIQADHRDVASKLLLILALFTPVTLVQRLLQMIFGVRLEDYIVQRTNIIANLLKIASVLYFFRESSYDIVGYFLFVQAVNLLAAVITLFIARKRYQYDFKLLIKSIRFNAEVFAKTRALALTSLYSALTWILYYEIDPAAIGKILGPNQVAIFAIGLTILSFFRSILGTLFAPFNVRFNHFVGLNDKEGLKTFYKTITRITEPVVVIPIIAVVLMAKPLIISWVGYQYLESVRPAQILVLCNLFAFISYPTSLLLMAQERIRMMYLVNTMLPFIYWIGIFSTYSFLGLNAFAIFKLTAFLINTSVFIWVLLKYLETDLVQLMQHYVRPVILPLAFMAVFAYLVNDYLPDEKSKMNLLAVATVTGAMILSALSLMYITTGYFKEQLNKILVLVKG